VLRLLLVESVPLAAEVVVADGFVVEVAVWLGISGRLLGGSPVGVKAYNRPPGSVADCGWLWQTGAAILQLHARCFSDVLATDLLAITLGDVFLFCLVYDRSPRLLIGGILCIA
jgi:hypothetical protein